MNIESVFPILCELLLKSAFILVLATAVNVFWRGASAASRHMIWTLVVATLLALPLTKLAAPLWTIELTPKVERTVLPPAPAPVTTVASSAPAVPAIVPTPSWSVPQWRTMLVFAWLAGVAAVLGYRCAGDLWLRRLRRQSEPLADQRTQLLAHAVAAECGLIDRIELRRNPACRVPLVWGIWRPVVLLSDSALAWPEQRLAAALRHEFCHVRRRDCLARLLAQLACAVYWMNPLVWMAARRLRVAQEQACDDLVLRSGANASDYADLLMQTVRDLGGSRRFARHAMAMAQPSTLEARVRAIVDERRNRGPLGRGAMAMGATAALALVAASALAQVKDKPDVNGPQIEIESKFVEMTEEAAKDTGLSWLFADPKPGLSGIVTEQQAQMVFKALSQAAGVDVLAAPRVTTLPKQRAKIEIVREMRYATEWEKDKKPGTWKPKTFETKNVGITFGVESAIKEDGSLDLDLKPEIVEFLGFIDLDNGKKELPPTATEMPAGHRVQPVFGTREVSAHVTAADGQTIVIGGMARETTVVTEDKVRGLGDAPIVGQLFRSRTESKVKRHLFVFVTPKIVKPAIAEKSATVTSDSQAHDKVTGAVTASGNVRIETPQAVIQADKVVINPKPGAAAAPAAAAQRAAKIVVPHMEFQEASLADVVNFLTFKSRELDPDKKGINILVHVPKEAQAARITLNLRDVPLLDAVRYVAGIAGLKMTASENALVIGPAKVQAAGTPLPAGAAAEKAKRIVVPLLEFRDAPLNDVLSFLVEQSRRLDPDKKGVNILWVALPSETPPAITLNLRNIPLLEALSFIAQIAGCELAADDHTLRLTPKQTW